MSWKIIVDSSSNLVEIFNLAENTVFERVPLSLQIGEETFVDDSDLDIDNMMEKMYAYDGAARSACPSPEAFEKSYEGADNVFVVTISSGLSGSYNSAKVAKEMFLEKNPNVNVNVIDSLAAGGELDVVAIKINELISQGLSFEEINEKIAEYQKTTKTAFILSRVDNLIKNGRMNKVLGTIVGLLNIRIVGIGNEEGKIELLQKARGDKKAAAAFVDYLMKQGYSGGLVRIAHRNNLDLVEKINSMIREKFENAKIEVDTLSGLCSFYAEDKGVVIGYETK